MTRSFKKLISINIIHSFYTEGACSDFEIMPTRECYEILKRYRLKVKQHFHGVHVIYEEADGNVSFPIDTDLKLPFVLKLKNHNFSIFTQLEEKTTSARTYHFTNNFNYAVDNPIPQVSLLPYDFDYTLQNTDATVVIEDLSANVVYSKDYTGNAAGKEVKISIKNMPKGRHTIKEVVSGTPTVTDEIYLDNLIRPSSIFGILEVDVASTIFDNVGLLPQEHVIEFIPKTVDWKYELELAGGLVLVGYTAQIKDSSTTSYLDFVTEDGKEVCTVSGKAYNQVPISELSLVQTEDGGSGEAVIVGVLPVPSVYDPNPRIRLKL